MRLKKTVLSKCISFLISKHFLTKQLTLKEILSWTHISTAASFWLRSIPPNFYFFQNRLKQKNVKLGRNVFIKFAFFCGFLENQDTLSLLENQDSYFHNFLENRVLYISRCYWAKMSANWRRDTINNLKKATKPLFGRRLSPLFTYWGITNSSKNNTKKGRRMCKIVEENTNEIITV